MKYLISYKIFENIEDINECFYDLVDMGFDNIKDITKEESDRLKRSNDLHRLDIPIPKKTFELVKTKNTTNVSGRISGDFTKDSIEMPTSILDSSSHTSKGLDRRKLNEYEEKLCSTLIDSIRLMSNIYLTEYNRGDYVIGFNNTILDGNKIFILIRFY